MHNFFLDSPRMIMMEPNVSVSGTTATVSWKKPAGIVSYYIVEYVLASEGFASSNVERVNSAKTTLQIDNLKTRSNYLLRVAARKSTDETSEFSPVVSFSTKKGEC